MTSCLSSSQIIGLVVALLSSTCDFQGALGIVIQLVEGKKDEISLTGGFIG